MAGASATPGTPEDDGVIPLADVTVTCTVCGASFEPVSGESTCRACTHVAPSDLVHDGGDLGTYGADDECPRCSYPMRGLPRSSACPECGHGARDEPAPRTAAPTAERRPTIALPVPSSPSSAPVPVELPRRRRSRRRPIEDDLVSRAPGFAVATMSLTLGALACAALAGCNGLSHWWGPNPAGPFAAAGSWTLFLGAAVCVTAPGSMPKGRTPRLFSVLAVAGAALVAAAEAAAVATSGIGGVPLGALWEAIALLGGAAFLVGMAVRLGALTEWAGQDPGERGFLAASGPTLLGIFIIANGYLLTGFFRRPLEFADAFAVACSTWLVWRLVAVAWHVRSAAATRSAVKARGERHLTEGPQGASRTEIEGPVCASCGYPLRGLRRGARCPECGSRERG